MLLLLLPPKAAATAATTTTATATPNSACRYHNRQHQPPQLPPRPTLTPTPTVAAIADVPNPQFAVRRSLSLSLTARRTTLFHRCPTTLHRANPIHYTTIRPTLLNFGFFSSPFLSFVSLQIAHTLILFVYASSSSSPCPSELAAVDIDFGQFVYAHALCLFLSNATT